MKRFILIPRAKNGDEVHNGLILEKYNLNENGVVIFKAEKEVSIQQLQRFYQEADKELVQTGFLKKVIVMYGSVHMVDVQEVEAPMQTEKDEVYEIVAVNPGTSEQMLIMKNLNTNENVPLTIVDGDVLIRRSKTKLVDILES